MSPTDLVPGTYAHDTDVTAVLVENKHGAQGRKERAQLEHESDTETLLP